MTYKNLDKEELRAFDEQTDERIQHGFIPDLRRLTKVDGFYYINIRWANSFTIISEIAEFLIKKQESDEPVSIDNMVGDDSENEMLKLIFKEALVPRNIRLRNMVEAGIKQGCSINPEDLPQAFI